MVVAGPQLKADARALEHTVLAWAALGPLQVEAPVASTAGASGLACVPQCPQ